VAVVPLGGTSGQVLAKSSGTDYDTTWATPVPFASPTFTGVPAAPTATVGTNTTQLATTEFANAAGGLVFIKSQTVGSAVSSVTVTNAFNADFEAYKIIATNVQSTVGANCNLGLTGLTSNYYGNLIYSNYASGSVLSLGNNNTTSFTHAGGTDGLFLVFNCDIINPFLAHPTSFAAAYQDNSNAGRYTGVQNQSTSASGFTLTAVAGTLTGGTIRVYGYRK
jgi:hypothetical protein